jgi:hypothetical protein
MENPMPALPEPNPHCDRLEAAADEAIASCGGDMNSAVRALILANEFLEWELATKVSAGYLRCVKYGR